MSQPDPASHSESTLEQAVAHLLRTTPETWAEYDPSAMSALQMRAVMLLTAAGMIERCITLRLRMAGHPGAVEAEITVTGEAGLAQAMEFVAKDLWGDWRKTFERGGAAIHCERIGNEQWRLTADGVLARHDLDAGRADVALDFVLKRGFFDDQPRMSLDDGRISQRLPVAGKGTLRRMQRVPADAGVVSVNITNWEAGAQAFAAAYSKSQSEQPKPPNETQPRRRGRKKADYETVQREAEIAANWERARDAGVYKPDFATDNNLTVRQLDALLDRVAKRKRHSE